MRKIFNAMLIWSLLSMLLADCSSKPSYSILDQSICTLPCWNNVVPGKTSEKEFLNTISTLKSVEQNSIIEIKNSSKVYGKMLRFEIKPNQTKEDIIYVEAYIQNDKVIAVSFLGGQLGLGLSLDKIMSDTGQPNGLVRRILPGNYTVFIMINQSKGLAFEHGTYDTNVNLEKSTPITALVIFSSDYYEKLMGIGIFSSGLNKDETMRIMYPWTGYGDANEKYPHRNTLK